MATLSKKPLIKRQVLEELAAVRLNEAKKLLSAGCYAGAIYLGGYAVECYLKVAICAALDWDELRTTFQTHNLEELLVHSGLERKMQSSPPVRDSFTKIRGLWTMEGNQAIRYRNPSEFKEDDALDFLRWVENSEYGVVSWVKQQI